MKKPAYRLIGIFILCFLETVLYAQPFTLDIQIKNQPGNHLILGKVIGDNFEPLDTLLLHFSKNPLTQNDKIGTYTFPTNFQAGMYRLILGQTTYAKIMNEPAQQLDFIYNNEHIMLETDFNTPKESLLVILSEENRVWHEFILKEEKLTHNIKEVELEMEYFRKKAGGDSISEKMFLTRVANYNMLQKRRERLNDEMVRNYPKLLAKKMIKMYREPFLDGTLTQEQRKEIFQKNFFDSFNFSDERLINTTVYTDRIFYFMTSYKQPGLTKEQLENEYIKAMDAIQPHLNKNMKVREFIIDYLLYGFEVLKMEKVIDYIAEKK